MSDRGSDRDSLHLVRQCELQGEHDTHPGDQYDAPPQLDDIQAVAVDEIPPVDEAGIASLFTASDYLIVSSPAMTRSVVTPSAVEASSTTHVMRYILNGLLSALLIGVILLLVLERSRLTST